MGSVLIADGDEGEDPILITEGEAIPREAFESLVEANDVSADLMRLLLPLIKPVGTANCVFIDCDECPLSALSVSKTATRLFNCCICVANWFIMDSNLSMRLLNSIVETETEGEIFLVTGVLLVFGRLGLVPTGMGGGFNCDLAGRVLGCLKRGINGPLYFLALAASAYEKEPL